MAYKAIIAGASGLIGSNLLNILLEAAEYSEVLVLVRKELPLKHKKLVQLVINFDDLGKFADTITGHAIFSCLGTTKSQAPDKEQYRKIDYAYPLQLAQLAKQNGVEQFHVVTAIGADKNSPVFYTKLKGELEDALQRLGLKTLRIYQPSMLMGERERSHWLENLATGLFKIIDPLLIGGLKKYRSIKGSTVAYVMFKKSLESATGTFIYTSDKIHTN
ncbi:MULTISPECIES: NAD(P)H-binding protein [unclassified Mucilaginibacter]|uniref:NAD(P)H-binding protein n=1 Tax=unclassified Mucilaginibacter TaxID=2617802 RepID=UPI002AC983A0|nr:MULTISPECIES: NAD(P)H-binding protein [unclassified Mucilaginibacter]MEB0261677.1 NAD(P)H-binding protein [Mucilaginibacter sp. 10I4]MEB0278327.1 NAD(P)H-binding protein [Mucilaginibacter sp. 10B2]MEB0303079.1 NAD(P)H-binding protein [Mucilaginibacter sp. 5C4]WPX23973.1 NAD(P)H-binding protein [Mucilaginibacter sp. 5C4]